MLDTFENKIFSENDLLLVLNIESSNAVTTRYLSGFSGSFSALIITPKRKIIITDSRYWTQVKEESSFELVKYTRGKTFLEHTVEIVKQFEPKKIAIEKDRINASTFEKLTQMLNDVEFTDVSSILVEARAVKTEKEIEIIQSAVEIAQEAFKKALEIVKPGMKESEFAAYMEYQMKLLGAEKPAFDTIVASGQRGALPHGKASEKTIERGEPVVVDWGAYYKGYNSDITRVFCIGEPNELVKKVHRIVYEAQERALKEIKAGKTGKEIDSLARDYITEMGYGEFFGHGLGHGLGMEVHEMPGLNYVNEKPLHAGNIVTVEPGIYLEGDFGIRIEEDVLVTEEGCRILTTLDRNLIIV